MDRGLERAWRASTSRARAATVRASNSLRTGISTPSARRTRDATWVARSECPPSWKKSSSTPTRPATRSPSTSAQIAARSASVALRGAVDSPPAPAPRSGAIRERARRSTLPLGVSGRAGRRTKALGTMYPGRLRREPAPGAPRIDSASPDDVGDQAARAACRPLVARARTTASRTPGRAASAASTSPSSMRKPRTFTWWSSRPRNSSSPVRQPAGQVAGAVEPRPRRPAQGSGTKRSAVSSGRPR